MYNRDSVLGNAFQRGTFISSKLHFHKNTHMEEYISVRVKVILQNLGEEKKESAEATKCFLSMAAGHHGNNCTLILDSV